MSRDSAQRWVVISALLVAGVYGYRRITEPVQPGKLSNILGIGELVPLGQFATAWGFTYLVVAIMAEAAPGLGGAFAILIAAADFLANTGSAVADIGKAESGKLKATTLNFGATALSSAAPAAQQAAAGGATNVGQGVGQGATAAAGAANVGQGVGQGATNPTTLIF